MKPIPQVCWTNLGVLHKISVVTDDKDALDSSSSGLREFLWFTVGIGGRLGRFAVLPFLVTQRLQIP